MPRPDSIQAPGLSTFQLTALSALLVTNEKMVASGELTLERSVTLRWLVAQTLTAFRMPAAYERESNDNDYPSQSALSAALDREDTHV